MIIIHAKRDGTVTTTPQLIPQGSSMQDITVLSEFDYAFCVLRLAPASGLYIPDVPCTPILQSDGKTLWTAYLPPEATVVAGSVRYSLIFAAQDGTQRGTLAGYFTVPEGAITNMPDNVGELEGKTIGDLYTVLSNIYALYREHGEHIDVLQEESKRYSEDLEHLLPLVSTIGEIEVPASSWSPNYPAEAKIRLPDIGENTVVFLIPANDITRVEATNAALAVMLDTLDTETANDSIYVVVRSEHKPSQDLKFTCVAVRGDGETEKIYRPSVSFVGIGFGGGVGSGNIDYDLVEAQIYKALEEVRNIECKVVDETLYITFDPKYNTVEVVDETLIIK